TVENILLLRPMGFDNEHINTYYKAVQQLDKEEELDKVLNHFDSNITKFKIMDKEPLVRLSSLNEYLSSTQVGDGVKKLINIFVSLYSAKDGVFLLDEIENGIHYTNLDKLWEIILTISKEQNVQVFATTHSKECIESYSRVSQKLEEEQTIEKDSIAFMEMGRNDENQITSIIYDSEAIYELSTQHQEIRGW
ncbi:MAG: AAA family ATPase, partial [Campylobacterota bacterium]|nr:AAA family ATPase [Campylobacterota bacterium]